MKKALCFFLAFFYITMFLFSQNKADFSGEWILNKERSQFQVKEFERLERGLIIIDHKEPLFRFERVFTSNGEEDRYTYELTTDGKEKTNQEGSQTLFSRLYWEGETLVFATRIIAPQGEATNTVRYGLIDEDRTLQAEEQFRGPRLKYDNIWILEKKS